MRRLATILPLLLSLLFCVSHANAESIYVNNITGSNSNTGADSGNQGGNVGPLRSIEAALKIAQRGDRIVLANTNVPYEECITLQGANHSGSAFAPFIIEGNGATLDGTEELPSDKWEFVSGDVHRFRPEVGGYQYLFIDGEPAEQMIRSNGGYVSSFLEPKQWCRCQGALHFMTEKGKSPYSYDLRYAKHRVGITLYDVHDVVIRNLTVRGFQLDGINAHDNAMDCILLDVTAKANGRSGFAVNGASRVKIVESEAILNGEIQLRLDDWSTTEVYRSEITDKYNPAWRRHLNRLGRGARLFIDELAQHDSQGWSLPATTGLLELTDEEPPLLPGAIPRDKNMVDEVAVPVDNPLDFAEEPTDNVFDEGNDNTFDDGGAFDEDSEESMDAEDPTNEEDTFGDFATDEPADAAEEEDAGVDLFEGDSDEDPFGDDF